MASDELVPLIETLQSKGVVSQDERNKILSGNTFGWGDRPEDAGHALNSLVSIIYSQAQTVTEARDTIARLRDEVERLRGEANG